MIEWKGINSEFYGLLAYNLVYGINQCNILHVSSLWSSVQSVNKKKKKPGNEKRKKPGEKERWRTGKKKEEK